MTIKRDYLGMFDVLKGFLMLIIVFVHHASFINGGMRPYSAEGVLPKLTNWSALVIGLFFVIAGYQLRPGGKWKDYVKKQFIQLIVPYFAAVILAALGRGLIWYLKTGEMQISTILAGGCYGAIQNVEIFGVWAYSVQALWFLPTFFFSGLIFRLLWRIPREGIRKTVVWGVTAAAVYFPDAYQIQLPFFLVQSCAVLGLMETGYILRKEKLLYRKLPVWCPVGACLLYLFCHLFSASNVASNVYRFGILDYAAAVLMSVVVLSGYVRLGIGEWKGTEMLAYIGRYSMLFLLVHGEGLLLIPWEEELGRWLLRLPGLSALPFCVAAGLIYVCRCIGIFAGCLGLDLLMRLKYYLKQRKRKELSENGGKNGKTGIRKKGC